VLDARVDDVEPLLRVAERVEIDLDGLGGVLDARGFARGLSRFTSLLRATSQSAATTVSSATGPGTSMSLSIAEAPRTTPRSAFCAGRDVRAVLQPARGASERAIVKQTEMRLPPSRTCMLMNANLPLRGRTC